MAQPNIKLSGVVDAVFPSVTFGNFEKRSVWIKETEGEYPQIFEVEFHQGDCNKLDDINKGDLVECEINLRGRKFNKKSDGSEFIINTLRAWKISKVGFAAPAPAPSSAPTTTAQVVAATGPVSSDDLPF